ncbi:uncharacterized protein B0T15DRAFT_376776, partial [Chaetomium strumarium]
LDPGCYGHPVVILFPEPEAGEVVSVFIITSFGGTDLAVRHPGRQRRGQYVPIAPADPHPDSGRLLFLADNARLPKKSWVNVSALHIVPLAILR